MENVADRRIALRLVDRTLVRIKTWRTEKGWEWETVIGAEPEPAEVGISATKTEALTAGLEAAKAKLH